jgi:hypothetical protein
MEKPLFFVAILMIPGAGTSAISTALKSLPAEFYITLDINSAAHCNSGDVAGITSD